MTKKALPPKKNTEKKYHIECEIEFTNYISDFSMQNKQLGTGSLKSKTDFSPAAHKILGSLHAPQLSADRVLCT